MLSNARTPGRWGPTLFAFLLIAAFVAACGGSAAGPGLGGPVAWPAATGAPAPGLVGEDDLNGDGDGSGTGGNVD